MSAPRSHQRHHFRRRDSARFACNATLVAATLYASFAPVVPSCLAQNAPVSTASPASPVSAPPSALRLKADLQRILSSDEYRPETTEKGYVTRMLQRARDYWDRLRKWFQSLFRSGGLEAGGTALIWTLVILMGGALGWIAFRLLRDWQPAGRAQSAFRTLSAAENEADDLIIRDPNHWQAQAEDYAQKQDYRRAYRALFIAALLKLEQVGALSYDRARTNGDYIRALRSGPNRALYETLLPPAQAFDRFWYGQEAAQAEDYRVLMEIYAGLPAASAAFVLPRNRDGASSDSMPGRAGKAGSG